MPHSCYTHTTPMLWTRYTHVTQMLHSCYAHATLMLRACYTHVTHLLHSCYAHATLMLHACYTYASCMLHRRYMNSHQWSTEAWFGQCFGTTRLVPFWIGLVLVQPDEEPGMREFEVIWKVFESSFTCYIVAWYVPWNDWVTDQNEEGCWQTPAGPHCARQ